MGHFMPIPGFQDRLMLWLRVEDQAVEVPPQRE